jgi:archaellum component FlaC
VKDKTQEALSSAERLGNEAQQLHRLAEEARIELHRMTKERELLARGCAELEEHKAELTKGVERLTTEVNELARKKRGRQG